MNRVFLTCLTLALPSFVAAAPCDILTYANQCQGSNLWPVPAGWKADGVSGDLVKGDCQPTPPAQILKEKYQVARVDRSLGAWCWVAYGSATATYPREAGTAGCAGSYSGGQPARVRCNEPWYILSPGFGCSMRRTTYNGDVPSSSAGVATLGPKSDGINPDYCIENYVGVEQRLTRCNEMYLAGWRWGCPTAGQELDVNGDGNKFTFDGPEGCFEYKDCPAGYVPASGSAGTTHCNWTGDQAHKPADGQCTARWTSSEQAGLQKDGMDPDCDADSCVFDGTCRLR